MFKFVKSLSGQSFQVPEVLPTTASETYTDGEGLVMTAGVLTKVAATAAPTYICGEAYVAPASANRGILVYPVLPAHIYETTFAADGSSITAGTKVTIHSDGAQITATTTNGVAYILKKLGTGASGTAAHVRFI